jgi:nicotinate-nucleotide--dimethylbenzimidazole phosphoribosyltransferase
MKLVLTGLNCLKLQNSQKPEPKPGFQVLDVQYCAISRTDAKMWSEGHPDLVFPRILGHELVARDEDGQWYTLWPGHHCGQCRYCLSDRENLCQKMKITGFHHDGGFSNYILSPEKSLIAVPESLRSPLACFAGPAGCVLHAIEKLNLRPNERMVIHGGGTLGLIAALASKDMGAEVVVIEKSEAKIAKATAFIDASGIACVKDTQDSAFDAGLNACPDPVAFSLGLTKLGKGGRYTFFSGLTKNANIETNLINLLHYKEMKLTGAHGLARQDMISALAFIDHHQSRFELLIEKIIAPQEAPDVLPAVLSSEVFKYILDFTDTASDQPLTSSIATDETVGAQPKGVSLVKRFEPHLRSVFENITPAEHHLRPQAQYKIDNKTKPLGALGTLEALGVQMCLIQNSLNPRVERKALLVFASDHGVVEEGVSAYPADVTGQMVANFLNGGAAINVLCRHNGIDLKVVDMGVNVDFETHPLLYTQKVRMGTRNFAIAPAMTEDEMLRAIQNGMQVFLTENTKQPIDIVGLGEMGIGNTTSAAAIISAVTGITPREATGRGTGINDQGLEHKIEVITKALNFHKPSSRDGFEILRKIGGFEIAGIVGATLAAASHKTAVVLDGVISTAAGLLAYLINPDIRDYLIAGHRSVEIAHKAALDHLQLEPVIDFNMRLGEGTGAAITIDVVDAACCIMGEMASFDDAGVSRKTD